jgi:F0F1-type ATP synthase membrane subunit b/b'
MDAAEKARRDLRRAQAKYERKVGEAKAERLESFKQAQKAGLSLREISQEVGLHWTRIGQLLRDE